MTSCFNFAIVISLLLALMSQSHGAEVNGVRNAENPEPECPENQYYDNCPQNEDIMCIEPVVEPTWNLTLTEQKFKQNSPVGGFCGQPKCRCNEHYVRPHADSPNCIHVY